MHWCADETVSLFMALPVLRLALTFVLGIVRRAV